MKVTMGKKSIAPPHTVYFFSIASFLSFCLISILVISNRIIPVDNLVQSKISQLWAPLLDKIMVFITNIVSTLPLLIISSMLIIFFLYQKKYLSPALLACSLVGATMLEWVIKHLIQRPRPAPTLSHVSGYSFPSGHSMIAMVFFSLLIYFFKDQIRNKIIRYSFIAINALLIILVGFSRIYLNVHWLSDVLGGFALGFFWLSLMIVLFDYINSA
ncbi:MAG: phosphatase PAP2 family protein [Nanoarchaeota archaeon]